jgi:hypothetical protein
MAERRVQSVIGASSGTEPGFESKTPVIESVGPLPKETAPAGGKLRPLGYIVPKGQERHAPISRSSELRSKAP